MSLQPKRRKLGKSTHKHTQETIYQTHTVEKGIVSAVKIYANTMHSKRRPNLWGRRLQS